MPRNNSTTHAAASRETTESFFGPSPEKGVMSDDICVICTDTLGERGTCELDCDHKFHARCIGTWFKTTRSDTCPLCRRVDDTDAISPMCVNLRAKWLRRVSLRRNTPIELVELVQKWRTAEAQVKLRKISVREHLRKNRIAQQTEKNLRQKYRRDRARLKDARRLVGIFNHPSFPVPLLHIGKRHV